MKLKIKFKDGLVFTQDITDSNFSGNGNLLELLRTGKSNNSNVTVEDDNGNVLDRKFADVYSFEIILGE